MSIHEVSASLTREGLQHCVVVAASVNPYHFGWDRQNESEDEYDKRSMWLFYIQLIQEIDIWATPAEQRQNINFRSTQLKRFLDQYSIKVNLNSIKIAGNVAAAIKRGSIQNLTDLRNYMMKRGKVTQADIDGYIKYKAAHKDVETVAAAAEFTIKPSIKLDAGDYASLRMYEGSQLRTQDSISKFSPLKVVNLYKKAVEKTIKPDPYLFQGIDMKQRPGCHTTLTVSTSGPALKSGEQILLSQLGRNDKTRRYEVLLVNAHGKPVYTREDITPVMTLKFTEMDAKVTAAVKSKLQQRVEEWGAKELDAKQIAELVALIKADSKLGLISKKFPKLHNGIEYVTVTKGDRELEFAYLNAGDTYATTLMRNPLTKKLEVTTQGDMIEYLESKGWQAN